MANSPRDFFRPRIAAAIFSLVSSECNFPCRHVVGSENHAFFQEAARHDTSTCTGRQRRRRRTRRPSAILRLVSSV
jgi:hypothetical protein